LSIDPAQTVGRRFDERFLPTARSIADGYEFVCQDWIGRDRRTLGPTATRRSPTG
jgi:hypothetical protein